MSKLAKVISFLYSLKQKNYRMKTYAIYIPKMSNTSKNQRQATTKQNSFFTFKFLFSYSAQCIPFFQIRFVYVIQFLSNNMRFSIVNFYSLYSFYLRARKLYKIIWAFCRL